MKLARWRPCFADHLAGVRSDKPHCTKPQCGYQSWGDNEKRKKMGKPMGGHQGVNSLRAAHHYGYGPPHHHYHP